MKIIKPDYKIITPIDQIAIMLELERFGRVSHLTEPKTSGIPFINACEFIEKWAIKAGHWTILEAVDITVEFTVNRGVTHEAVRHRMTSPMQESTRYCNYGKDRFENEITVIDIKPHLRNPLVSLQIWMDHMEASEKAYLAMLAAGEPAEIARDVLPNGLKSTIDIKCNLREWRWIFEKRAHWAAHPQMREVMIPLLEEMRHLIPVIFDDIYDKLFK